MVFDKLLLGTNIAFGVIAVFICIYFILRAKHLDVLSKRSLLIGFFFAIHEISFFLGDAFVFELTKTLLFISIFYALSYIILANSEVNKRIEEDEKYTRELKRRFECLKATLEAEC